MERSWTVGAAAERLGIAAPTLRTWERRYGLGPSTRTAGGHRRYNAIDLDRVQLMRQLVELGSPPGEAASAVLGLGDAEVVAEVAHHDVDLGENERTVGAIVVAASRFEGERLSRLIQLTIRRLGLVDAWQQVLAPTLVEIGHRWQDGRVGVETEHLVSARILASLRSFSRDRPAVADAPVILASAEEDQHKLAVVALEAALAERQVGVIELGARLPAESLRSLVDAIDPKAVFLWASLPRDHDDDLAAVITEVSSTVTVILGGPGWGDSADVTTLAEARDAVLSTLTP